MASRQQLARRERERDIVDATRALFDERGVQDAPIEEIARAVGINKALIYRHFSSKDELFVLTVTRYLDELAEMFGGIDPALEPEARLRAACERYTDFCLAYPAFLDCALSLMREPAAELRERLSEGVWLQLGRAMASCLGPLSAILADGAVAGVFAVEDPDFTANQLYTASLGVMHLARIGVGVRIGAGGLPEAFAIDPGEVRRAAVSAALAQVRRA